MGIAENTTQFDSLNWDDFRLILAVAREGSLVNAARQLKFNHAAVSRRLRTLERKLSVTLFLRVESKVRATDFGEILVAAAERLESHVLKCQEDICALEKPFTGIIRMTSVPILLNRVILPRIGSFADAHPDIAIETSAQTLSADFGQHDVDLALLFAWPRSEIDNFRTTPHCRKVADITYSIYRPVGMENVNLRLINYTDAGLNLPQTHWMADKIDECRLQSIRVDDAQNALEVVASGFGQTLLPDCVARHDCRLEIDGERSNVLSCELLLLSHPERQHLQRVRLMSDWLQNLFVGEQSMIGYKQ